MALNSKPLSMITIPARTAPAPDAVKINAHIAAETAKPASKPVAKAKPESKPEPAPTATQDAMATALASMSQETLAALLAKAGFAPEAKPAETVSKPIGKVGTLPAPANPTYTLDQLREMADRDPVTAELAGYIGGNVLVTTKTPLGNRTITAAATVIAIETRFVNSKGRSFPAPSVWCYSADHGISRQSPTRLGELDTMPDASTIAAGLKAYNEEVRLVNCTGTIDTVYKSGATIKMSDGRRPFAKRDDISGKIDSGHVVHFKIRRCDLG